MQLDNTTLQILANYCSATTEVMAHTLMRTAHSTFVKETEDFTTQLLTPEGLTFASPKGLGATWFTGLDYGPALAMIDHYEDGDICITSDPYSGYVATHSPDQHIWKPVFHEGELMCFVAGHIHNTDVGGAVPASLSRALVEVHQEGLRLPPLKIMTKAGFNDDVVRLMRINVRMPDQNWGDLKAQIAAVNIGEARVHEIIERFGVDVFRACQPALLDYAERQAREIVRSIPDGEYFFADYADEDAPDGYPCRIAVTLKVSGETLIMDFTGSDPQLASSLNMPTGGNERHALVTPALILVLATLNPHLVLNYGTSRVARAILPEGTIMNATAPAAVGMRSLTVAVSQLAVLGAFQRALPDKLAAAPAGSASLMNVKTTNRQGTQIMASIGPISGGGGGSPSSDGAEGCGGNRSFLKNTPVEINEVEVPIKILQYGLVTDSGGAGKYRGGSAMIMDFQVFAPNSVVTARNRNRTRFSSWGVLGGGAGGRSEFLLNPGTMNQKNLYNTDVVACAPGDVLSIRGPGAGGYGDPLARDVEAVTSDVRGGFVSRQAAQDIYGVVVDETLALNAEATQHRRSQDQAQQKARIQEGRREISPSRFDYGVHREAFESIWDVARYETLTGLLAQLPVSWRYFVKHKIFAKIGDAPGDGTGQAVTDAYRTLTLEFSELAALELARQG